MAAVRPIALKKSVFERSSLRWQKAAVGLDEASAASYRRDGCRHRHQLGELAEVLSCSGEVELVAGTIWPA
jgi:hypothetical protein